MMDHISTNSFTRLQCFTDDINTIAVKRSYELYAGSFGVNVKSWHTDNGIFAEKAFRDEFKVSNQTITFYGVGVHHQNGIIENYIGVLTRGSRCFLLHAHRR